jgi:trehalose/maltose hydrolase-like predicted phosphorylase
VRGWELIYEGFDPAQEGLREALCTLGNGYFATRAASPESHADGTHVREHTSLVATTA